MPKGKSVGPGPSFPLQKRARFNSPKWWRTIALTLADISLILFILCDIGLPNRLVPGWEWACSELFSALHKRRNITPAERYNYCVARGWESKSVEAQQDEAAGRTSSEKPRLTREAAARLREKESLRLSVKRVVEQLARTRDPRHRSMLEQALADLERKLRELGSV
jgi:hypothetical protein